jgi:conjugative transfer signal peptidase TraF
MVFLKKFLPLFLALTSIFVLFCVVTRLQHVGYAFTYQVSDSVPRGFYLLLPPRFLQRGDLVTFFPPENTEQFLQDKHWVPRSGVLMKYIAALPGDEVCNQNGELLINHVAVAPIYQFYAPEKELPQTPFCGKLLNQQYLLVSTKIARSFDGRYFGPVSERNILHKAVRIN